MYWIYLGRSSTKMNWPIIYSAVGVAVAILIIFAFLGNGSFNRVVISGDETKQTTIISAAASAITIAPIDIKVKNVVASKTNDEKTANVQVAFDVHNPDKNTMILDGIHYNVYVNNTLMTSGNIGTEAPEDVIRS
jgi:hypothetical protein